MVKVPAFLFCLASFMFAQAPANLGIFEGASDVGSPSHKGSVTYDPATGEYRITGGGNNIWGNKDDFFFVWKKLSGNFAMSATMKIITPGGEHRKAGIMFRKELETGSPYADVAVHGVGLTAIQWREKADDVTRGADFPIELAAPAPAQIKLVRSGGNITLFAAKDGGPLVEQGTVLFMLGSPVYAGLAVCPHDDKSETTVIFSNVKLEMLPTVGPEGGQGKGKGKGKKKE
jgi:hypothetical protein